MKLLQTASEIANFANKNATRDKRANAIREKIQALSNRLQFALESDLHKTQQQLDEAQIAMKHRIESYLQNAKQSVEKQDTALRALSPLAVLNAVIV